jgi:hypothetical protein
MEHMNRNFKPGDNLLRAHKESTLEKNQKERMKPKPQEEAVSGKDDILNKKMNERMKRKAALLRAMNKIHDPDIA